MNKISVISLGDSFDVKTWPKSQYSLAEAFKNKQFSVGGCYHFTVIQRLFIKKNSTTYFLCGYLL